MERVIGDEGVIFRGVSKGYARRDGTLKRQVFMLRQPNPQRDPPVERELSVSEHRENSMADLREPVGAASLVAGAVRRLADIDDEPLGLEVEPRQKASDPWYAAVLEMPLWSAEDDPERIRVNLVADALISIATYPATNAAPTLPGPTSTDRSPLRQRAQQMADETLIAMLEGTWGFEPDSSLDIERIGERNFRVTEVRPDLSVVKSISGYITLSAGASSVNSTLNPVLNLQQLAVYDQALMHIEVQLAAAEAVGKAEALLWSDGEFPELLKPFQGDPPNQYASTAEGMLPVLHALDDFAKLRDLEIGLWRRGDNPWELWIAPARRRRY